jgi:hypothetical protein
MAATPGGQAAARPPDRGGARAVRSRPPRRAPRSRGGRSIAATERVDKALVELPEAFREWQGVAQRVANLLSVVDGADGRDVPDLHIDAVLLEAERARERGIPTPLPRRLYPGEGEDPTIRSAA